MSHLASISPSPEYPWVVGLMPPFVGLPYGMSSHAPDLWGYGPTDVGYGGRRDHDHVNRHDAGRGYGPGGRFGRGGWRHNPPGILDLLTWRLGRTVNGLQWGAGEVVKSAGLGAVAGALAGAVLPVGTPFGGALLGGLAGALLGANRVGDVLFGSRPYGYDRYRDGRHW